MANKTSKPMTKEARRLLLEWLQQARLCWYRDGTTWFPPKCEYWWNAYCIILPYQLERKLNFPLKANKILISMTKEVTMLLLVWLQQARLQQYRDKAPLVLARKREDWWNAGHKVPCQFHHKKRNGFWKPTKSRIRWPRRTWHSS